MNGELRSKGRWVPVILTTERKILPPQTEMKLTDMLQMINIWSSFDEPFTFSQVFSYMSLNTWTISNLTVTKCVCMCLCVNLYVYQSLVLYKETDGARGKKHCQTENCNINHNKILQRNKKRDESWKFNKKSFKKEQLKWWKTFRSGTDLQKLSRKSARQ